MGGLQVVYLTDEDYARLTRLKKRLGVSKNDVVWISMQMLEDALNRIDKARAGVDIHGGDGNECAE